MASTVNDNSQWLSVNEETLFLHDGLIRVTDLVELPHDVNNSSETDQEVITFDTKSPLELSDRLQSLCGTQNNTYTKLLEYRLNALRGLWSALRQIALEEQIERDASSQEETIALLKKQGLWQQGEQVSFSSRVSLLLVFPLLQSQSRIDKSLCGITAELLLNCLKDCPPFCLMKEPSDCLNGLETLLCTWLGETENGNKLNDNVITMIDKVQRENASSALVALSCARGSIRTFIHTIHLLQSLSGLGPLAVDDILGKLIEVEGGQGCPTSLLGTKHYLSWSFEDMLNPIDKENTEKDKGVDYGRSITCDGKFLYTTNYSGKGLAKIGTGLHGTLRAYVYSRNTELLSGRIALGNEVLLHRPHEYDLEKNWKLLAQIINCNCLQVIGQIHHPAEYLIVNPITTIQFCSDNFYFYWVWCPGSTTDKNSKGQSIFLDSFKYQPDINSAIPLRERIVLQRKEDGAGKSISESLLARLRPYRSTTATLVALSGSSGGGSNREDSSLNTSCGLPLKNLHRSPIYTCGSTLVILSPVPGSSNNSTARSLFGSGSSLATLRSLASNLCFNVTDGQFITRTDLIDASTCALARGAPLQGLGICYDAINNMIWTCSNDWVDQFYNPSHQAAHHIYKKLGIEPLQLRKAQPDGKLPVSRVIAELLQHVGSMCCHQLNNDLVHIAIGNIFLQQQSIDLIHLERTLDILERAIIERNERNIRCTLVILQVKFKSFVFKDDKEKQLISRASSLVWQLLTPEKSQSEQNVSGLEVEACNVICAGLHVLYPTPNDWNSLLHRLLTDGDSTAALIHLRELILLEFSDQLRNLSLPPGELQYLRLNDDLVHYILKIAVKESCLLLYNCVSCSKENFEETLASLPLASPCLRYLMALQSHILREIVLFKDISQQELCNSNKENMQDAVLTFASKVFLGAYEVLEVLLEVCNKVINNSVDDLETRLQGLERVTKATILGHLLPVLITSLTHYNLHSLKMADILMSQLVQLVTLTSQAALLLKSQVQVIRQDDLSSDSDVIQLIGESLTLESGELEEKEEAGFLAGLKIPAPWATGKTVETIHPVRDNYKFKETVQIPGARCLYLRFDPRCSSQYDYDKLVLYAGPNTNSRKVAEYGGNTHGFGSRSVLGSGWPKDLIKIDGDTVTFSFEMRSGREHNTPDKAMWGFVVTVRAQESPEEVSNGLPFLADLALGLSVLACTMLHLLYQGPEKTKDEEICDHLLKSRLLQRCLWQSESGKLIAPMATCHSGVSMPIDENAELSMTHTSSSRLPRIKLSQEIMHKLRELSGRAPPQLRPSIKEVLQPSHLEECIMSAILKHLGLMDTVRHLTHIHEFQSEEFQLLCSVLSEAYKKVDALIRRLQALAELEQRWQIEVDDVYQGMLPASMAFFADYHLAESKAKELALLCYLKDIDFDPLNLEASVTALREKLELEASIASREPITMGKTRKLLAGIIERVELLLQVTITIDTPRTGSIARSMSVLSQSQEIFMKQSSDSSAPRSFPTYSRSLSAPSDLEGFQEDLLIPNLQWKCLTSHQKGTISILQDLIPEDNIQDRPNHSILLDQLYSFIGSHPEKAVSCQSFLSAAQVRWRRGHTRKQALIHMKELLTAASRVGGATHLIAAVISVLQHGPRIDELTCGGMAAQVREAFAETMTSVVQLAARYPLACCNSIGLLCIIPYTRSEEKCLVRSGLVHLLDRLCSLSNYRGDTGAPSDTQSMRQRVSAMAWAGFQVLSNRCVMWEEDEGYYSDELEHSGLARQVSMLLTNHLARATEGNGNEAAGNEALQEVLSLLNNLSRSKMGKAILSQPACVSKLLSLLLDKRPSPKLVLIILQLCRVALPLMSADDCEKVHLPSWNQEASLFGSSDPPSKITSLLLAKLGDYVVPGGQTTISNWDSENSLLSLHSACGSSGSQEKDRNEETDVQDGRMTVYLHKRSDQSSHEIIQPLLSSSDGRLFRSTGGASMERVVRMDREMTKFGKAEVCTEDAVSALRRAAKWAQSGLVVSTGPPLEGSSIDQSVDKKKTATEIICKEKNSELVKTDPIRPFISGHVANSMAAEVIALLRSLITTSDSSIAQVWASAVEKVLSNALSHVPALMQSIDSIGTPKCNISHMMTMAWQVVAAMCGLGGFKETIKTGSEVLITGVGVHNSQGTVLSLSEQQGIATVKLDLPKDSTLYPRASDIVQVPISRLIPPRNEPLPLDCLSMTETLIKAVHAILVYDDGKSSLLASLPVHGDGNNPAMSVCRVVAEIKTRACMVLALHMKNKEFASAFINQSSSAIDILKSLAKDTNPGDRLPLIESHCERLRMLYRDCAKPPPPPNKNNGRTGKEIIWDTIRAFPPVRASLFSHGMTGITFLGDPSAGSGLPRGTFVYATQPIPQQAPSFYWEIEICSFGESHDDSGPIISFGFAPSAEKKDGGWTNPVGTVLFHNNGRAVHYNGSSLLQWKSVRLDVTLNSGDVAGCGWERQGEMPTLPGLQVKGHVFFTHNGQRLSAFLEDVTGGLWPVVHIQKKSTRVKANFGARPFAFAEGQFHRDAADECSDSTEEISANFGLLPFHGGSDSESDISEKATISNSSDNKDLKSPSGIISKFPSTKFLREYNNEASLHYKLSLSYDNFTSTGPDIHPPLAAQDDESDKEDVDDEPQQEDHYALLVKAWESKIFPIIRRRFRNEAERKDGLEQIKGALQLGMTDIARQTVEFLYEESGGMPRDLHLPTIEDIKEEVAKFAIERMRKGTAVVIRNPTTGSSSGSTVLPKFAVRSMLKTLGLTGVVLDVDTQQELVQVETYLRSEGVLVRFWYPIDMLERPPQGYRKTALTGLHHIDTSNILIHKELMHYETMLSCFYCRTTLLRLIEHCNNPVNESQLSLSSDMAASAAMLQELDIENLQLLSNELLYSGFPNGTLSEFSLDAVFSSQQLLSSYTFSVGDIFYQNLKCLEQDVSSAIHRAAKQGEDYLIELTNQICMCLQLAPEYFPWEEYIIGESKVSTDVTFPGMAFLCVSCRNDPKQSKKDTVNYKVPVARIFCYCGLHIKRNGEISRQEVMCYPRDYAASGSTPIISDQYPSVLLPCDQIHIKLGASVSPGIILTIHAIPPQFPLAIAYIKKLLNIRHKEMQNFKSSKSSSQINLEGNEPFLITSQVLLHVLELLSGYLWRTDIPALLKENVFHIYAEVLRAIQMAGEEITQQCSLLLISQLQCELKYLYEEEVDNWGGAESLKSGLSFPFGESDHARFSTYFHALMEVSLAAVDIVNISPSMSIHSPGISVSSSIRSLTPSPPSPSAISKRKKLKIKREKSGSKSKSAESPRTSESEPSTSVVPSSVTNSKPEDMLWFHLAVTVSQILRYLTYNDSHGHLATNDAISDACKALNISSAHNRLLVISGIPTTLDEHTVKQALHKACNSSGGLFKEEIWLPLVLNEEEDSKKDLDEDKSFMDLEKKDFHEIQEKPNEKKCSLQKRIKGCAVVELRCSSNLEEARKAIFKSKILVGGLTGDSDELMDVPDEMLTVSTVNESLSSEPQGNGPLEDYLTDKLIVDKQQSELTDQALIALTEIFHSCFISEHKMSNGEPKYESGYICLTKEQIMSSVQGNLLCTFFSTIRSPKKQFSDQITSVLKHYGLSKYLNKESNSFEDKSVKGKDGKFNKKSSKISKEKIAFGISSSKSSLKEKKAKFKESFEKSSKESDSFEESSKENVYEEEKTLTLDGFIQYVSDKIKQDVQSIWRALLTCGYDFHLDRYACIDVNQAQQMSSQWTLEMDSALIDYINKLCQKLAITPALLKSQEIYLSTAELSSPSYSCLRDVPLESIRLRFALLQSLNSTLESLFLPLVDLRPVSTFKSSTAALLANTRGLIFYDTKVSILNKLLNVTSKRKPDQAAPEITVDPLETIGTEIKNVLNTQFCQAVRQLSGIPSSQLCVRLASGGDPTFAFNVRLTGEEVLGTSGSFRHFLSQVARELQGLLLNLLIPCPSSAANKNKGKYILKPGPMTYSEEKLLQTLGQVLGITIRADIPLPFDLLHVFWKNLVHIPLDPVTDLQEVDILTYSYIKKFGMVENVKDLEMLCEEVHYPRFVYTTLTGEQVELCPNGRNIFVNWDNHQHYVEAIHELRMKEFACHERTAVVRSGLASIIPIQLLSLMTYTDMELRTCGFPEIDLDFLKAHTMYQVGLMDSDTHIEYFWTALESFSQEELRKFIKFSCNQERIPNTCPCKNGQSDTAHVPPYPMKIAPPDGSQGSPDSRFIRVETCMFMIKLPQYSCQEIMTERLLYAIHCREDPLSG